MVFQKGNQYWKLNIGRKHTEETKRKMGLSKTGNKHPLYGKHHTKKTIKKISKKNKNKHFSPKTEFKKGECSGKNHPMYGKHHTEETRRKISVANRGHKHTEETRKKISESIKESYLTRFHPKGMLGKHHSKESRKKMRGIRNNTRTHKFICANCEKKNEGKFKKNFVLYKNHFCNFKCKGEWQKENLKGKNNPYYGKRHSEETIKKLKNYERTEEHMKNLSNSLKKLYLERKMRGIRNHFYGKQHTQATKILMSKNHKDTTKNKNPMYGKSGKLSPGWKGGLSFEPYTKDFNNKFKRAIRKRDNQICMLCGVHREKLNRALNVHHINYDKSLSIPQNCISLCLNCHMKTNHNRKHFVKFLQSLLEEKYGYKYENDLIVYDLMEVKK